MKKVYNYALSEICTEREIKINNSNTDTELTLLELIGNMIDELSRAEDYLCELTIDEGSELEWLVNDIRRSLDRTRYFNL